MLIGTASETREDTGRIRRQETCMLLVSIREIREGGLYGHIICERLKLPVPYRGTCDLMLKVDAISKRFGPSGGGEYRSLQGGPAASAEALPPEYREELSEECRMSRRWGTECYRLGAKDAFCLQIAGRQNYSLQGRLIGSLTGGSYVCFRSAMELMQMLSSIPEINKNKAAKKSRRRREESRV